PYTIRQPGSYVFAGNLSSSDIVAITVAVGNVDLNGAGYTLDGQDGTLTFYGIHILAVSGVRIHNVNVTRCFWGIAVDASSKTVIAGNTATGNAGGILVSGGSSGNIVIGNDLSHNGPLGIIVHGNNNILTSNTADYNWDGIVLGSLSTGNRAQANRA